MRINEYTIINKIDEECNDIFVFNKILRNLINDTVVLSRVPKVYSQIFSGMWDVNLSSSDYEIIREYASIHREDRKEKEKDNRNNYVLKNPVIQSEML